MIKTNIETLEMKCFLPDYPKKCTKKHDESLSFDYRMYIHTCQWNNDG